MADSPNSPHAGTGTHDDSGVTPSRTSISGMPRWMMIGGSLALIVVLLFAVMMLVGGGGNHGPGRHMPSGNSGSAPASSLVGNLPLFDSGFSAGLTSRDAQAAHAVYLALEQLT